MIILKAIKAPNSMIGIVPVKALRNIALVEASATTTEVLISSVIVVKLAPPSTPLSLIFRTSSLSALDLS